MSDRFLNAHQRGAIAQKLADTLSAAVDQTTTDAYVRADIIACVIASLGGIRQYHLECVPETHWGHGIATLHLAETTTTVRTAVKTGTPADYYNDPKRTEFGD